jgi:cyclase
MDKINELILTIMKNLYSLILILLITGTTIFSQKKDTLIKVTENVYEITGFVGNVSFLVTTDGVLLVDAGNNPEAGEKILKYISSVTNKPLRYIVATHYHNDHTGGLSAFPKSAVIIGQTNIIHDLNKEETRNQQTLQELIKKTDSLKLTIEILKDSNDIKFKKADSLLKASNKEVDRLKRAITIYPTGLVDSLKTLLLGSDTIQLIYPGKAHTDGDLVVYIKSKKVLVMGDLLFNHCFPYIDPVGNVENWIKQLRIFAAYDVKYFVPGHSYLADKADMLLFSDYLNDLYQQVKSMKSNGKSLDEIKKTLKLPAYDSFGFAFFRLQNIEAVYGQIK